MCISAYHPALKDFLPFYQKQWSQQKNKISSFIPISDMSMSQYNSYAGSAYLCRSMSYTFPPCYLFSQNQSAALPMTVLSNLEGLGKQHHGAIKCFVFSFAPQLCVLEGENQIPCSPLLCTRNRASWHSSDEVECLGEDGSGNKYHAQKLSGQPVSK
jgi:hypothetical protein